MINIRIFRTVLSFDFSFFAVVALCLFFDDSGVCLLSLIFSALHEAGHLAALSFFGEVPENIVFYGAGIKICSNLSRLDKCKKIIVLSYGCTVNVIIAVISVLCGNTLAASINIIMAVFNMLPIGYLDGALILRVCLEKYDNCEAIMRIVGIAFAVVLLIMTISLHTISVSIMLTVLYILCMMAYY